VILELVTNPGTRSTWSVALVDLPTPTYNTGRITVMSNASSSSSTSGEIALVRVLPLQWHAEYCKEKVREHGDPSPYSYEMKLGRMTIDLNPIEFRILNFLAASPYRAFTRRRIAEAASREGHAVTESSITRHVASLRGKLGFFGDYIQTVRFIGYRFKA
jgi:hypothetical protein